MGKSYGGIFSVKTLFQICLCQVDKTDYGRNVSEYFYKTTFTLIPKPDKDTRKKRFINYSPSKDTKILNKMLAK